MRAALLALAFALSACASTSAQSMDSGLAAFQSARVRECPPDRIRAGAHTSGPVANVGTQVEDVAIVPAADPARAVRLRRLTVPPGGLIRWHDHRDVQGMALIVSGQLIETRGDCLDEMTYRAGDIAREDAATMHAWRNETDTPAIVMVMHIIAR